MAPDQDRKLAEVVYGLVGTVNAFKTSWEKQDTAARDGRRALYEKIEAHQLEVRNKFEGVQSTVSGIGHKLDVAILDINEMKPAVRNWVASKNWALGAKSAAVAIGAAIAVAGSFAGWVIEHFLLK